MNILIVSLYDCGYNWSVALIKEDGTIVRFQEDEEIRSIITSFEDYKYLNLRLISYLSDYRINKVVWCEDGSIDYFKQETLKKNR